MKMLFAVGIQGVSNVRNLPVMSGRNALTFDAFDAALMRSG